MINFICMYRNQRYHVHLLILTYMIASCFAVDNISVTTKALCCSIICHGKRLELIRFCFVGRIRTIFKLLLLHNKCLILASIKSENHITCSLSLTHIIHGIDVLAQPPKTPNLTLAYIFLSPSLRKVGKRLAFKLIHWLLA